jgi:hypothetical protein
MLADMTDLGYLVDFASRNGTCECDCHGAAGCPCIECQKANCEVMQQLILTYNPYA